jgi:predicted nicotinamide N-methyase
MAKIGWLDLLDQPQRFMRKWPNRGSYVFLDQPQRSTVKIKRLEFFDQSQRRSTTPDSQELN